MSASRRVTPMSTTSRKRSAITTILSMIAAIALSVPALAPAAPLGTSTSFPAGGGTPTAIAPGSDGNLWYTTFVNPITSRVNRITPSGTVTQFTAGLNPGTILNPGAITPGADGNR